MLRLTEILHFLDQGYNEARHKRDERYRPITNQNNMPQLPRPGNACMSFFLIILESDLSPIIPRRCLLLAYVEKERTKLTGLPSDLNRYLGSVYTQRRVSYSSLVKL